MAREGRFPGARFALAGVVGLLTLRADDGAERVSSSDPESGSSRANDHVVAKARGGLSVTFLGQGFRLGAQMGATLVLARFLGPAEFGLVGIALPVSGLLISLVTSTFSMFAVQRQALSERDLSVVFWLNMVIGGVLTAAGWLIAPVLAWVYGKPDVQGFVQVLSCGALVHGWLGSHQAVLARRMSYRRLMVAESGSAVLGSLIAAILAWGGAGAWSLVFMQFGTSCIHAVAAAWMSRWSPQWAWDRDTAAEVFEFGWHLSVFNLLNFFGRNADDVLIGWWLGEHALGLYMLAYRLLLLPSRAVMIPIARVVVASLSRLQQVPDAWGRHYLQMMNLTLGLSFPIIVVSRYLVEDIIGWMFGESWLPAAVVFVPLSVVAVLQAAFQTFGWVWISLGETARRRTWAMIAIPVSMGGIGAGLPWGIEGVAIGYATASACLFLPGVAFAMKRTPVTLGEFLWVLRRPLVSLLAMELVMVVFTSWWGQPSPGRLVVGGSLVGFTFVASIVALYGAAPLVAAAESVRSLRATPSPR